MARKTSTKDYFQIREEAYVFTVRVTYKKE
jgi:hypothetical protein